MGDSSYKSKDTFDEQPQLQKVLSLPALPQLKGQSTQYMKKYSNLLIRDNVPQSSLDYKPSISASFKSLIKSKTEIPMDNLKKFLKKEDQTFKIHFQKHISHQEAMERRDGLIYYLRQKKDKPEIIQCNYQDQTPKLIIKERNILKEKQDKIKELALQFKIQNSMRKKRNTPQLNNGGVSINSQFLVVSEGSSIE